MSQRYIGGLVYNAPGGWSGQFSGANYLSVASAAGNALGSGDFTIQLWFYLTGTTGAGSSGEIGLIGCGDNTSSRYTIRCQGTSTRIMSWWLNTPSNNVTGTTSISLNTWYHVALVRSGSGSNNVKLYLNGVLESQGTSTYNSPADNISIGRGYPNLNAEYTNGYISNVQIVVGTALYTNNFTPPTGAFLPVTNTALLTCRYPTFIDGSTNNYTVTNNSLVTVNTANPFPTSVLPSPALGNAGNGIYTMSQYTSLLGAGAWPAYDPYYKNVTLNLHGNAGTVLPFNTDASTNNFQVTQVGDTSPSNYTPFITNGYWSNLFNGSSGVTVSSTSSQFGFSGDFTWEAWVNLTSLPSSGGNYSIICSRGSVASNSAFQFLIGNSSGTYQITGTISISSSDSNLTWNISSAPSVGIWYHVAIVRSGSSVQAYWNGAAIGSAQTASGTTNTPTVNPSIGFRGGAYNDLFFNGYISNFRMVGSAVYTSNFTPSTIPLTAISGTRVLTCQSNRFVDNSTNVFTLAAYSAPSVNPLQPFTAPTGTSAYGSGYFDGSGDYLTCSSSATNLSTSSFTIEFWINFSALPASGSNANIISATVTNGVEVLYRGTGSYIEIGRYGVGPSLQYSWSPALNAWNHVAFVRSGTTVNIYINGTSVASGTVSQDFQTGTTNIGSAGGTQSYLNGYLSNVRVVKGTAVYTGNFTPSTTPLTAISGTSLLTLQTNAPSQNNTFLDSSTNNFLITRNGNTTQGTFSPYGLNWSNYFDGTGDYLTAGSSISLSGNFTVEGWVYRTVASGNGNYLFGLGNDTFSGGATFFVDSSTGYLRIYTSQAQLLGGTSAPVPLNTWTHIAFVRSSNTLRAYLNGVQVDSASWSATISGTAYINAELNGNPTATVYAGSAGYLSNIRINTTAVYTAAFTPSTGPLTAITGTSLLTCADNRFIDDSTNAYTITRNGDVSVQRFSPFNPTSAYTTSVIGGSGYFDGSGDYLSFASNDAFRVDQGDWTIEGWMYMNSLGASTCLANRGVYVSVYSFFAGTNGNTLYYEAGTGGWAATGYSSSANAVVAGQWNHVAFVRSGTSLFMYSNGTRVFSQTVGSVGANVNAPMWVGQYLGGTAGLNGYMTDFRFVKGTAIYTGATYTVPTAPLTAVANTSLLLNYTNAAIIDNAMMGDLETVGNAQISTSVKKYGTGSMYFDGTGDYLKNITSPVITLSGNFTVECWLYLNSTAVAQPIISYGTSGSATNLLFLYNTSVGLRWYFSNGTVDINQGSTSGWATGTWYHVAAVRSGSTLTLYRNGTSIASGTTTQTYQTGAQLNIGGSPGDSVYLDGYIDDFRITNGVARYTTTFTPPTSQVQDQ
jgi:hypothetical protein